MEHKNEIFDAEYERLDEINEDLKLIQRKGGLTFGTDAYLLSAFVKKNTSGSCADFGCGTGVISLLMAQRKKFRRIYSFELQKEYAALTERNVALNGLNDTITVINKDIREVTQAYTEGELDTVVTNPPYMKTGSGLENFSGEMNIARRELNGTIYDFCRTGSKLLRSGGAFYAVYRADRITDLICAMRESDIEAKTIITVYPDTHSRPSLVLVEGKKGASSGVILTRPLFVYKDKTREYTEDMATIYEDFTLDHITKLK